MACGKVNELDDAYSLFAYKFQADVLQLDVAVDVPNPVEIHDPVKKLNRDFNNFSEREIRSPYITAAVCHGFRLYFFTISKGGDLIQSEAGRY